MRDRTYDISGIDLADDTYTVVQSLVRNKYRAEDSSGTVVLRGKQKLLKLKEQFPFVDADGTEVFSVKAAGMLDVAGSYVLSDSQTGEDLVILDNDYRDSRTRGRSATPRRRRRSRGSSPAAP